MRVQTFIELAVDGMSTPLHTQRRTTEIMDSLCFDDTIVLKERVKQLVKEVPYVIAAFNRSKK